LFTHPQTQARRSFVFMTMYVWLCRIRNQRSLQPAITSLIRLTSHVNLSSPSGHCYRAWTKAIPHLHGIAWPASTRFKGAQNCGICIASFPVKRPRWGCKSHKQWEPCKQYRS
jgi:hypothetical protein